MPQQPTAGPSRFREIERRRSGRIFLTVPVLVKWKTADGEPQEEHATTEELNSLGGVLRIKRVPPGSAALEVTHPPTGDSVVAHVIRVEDTQPDGLARIAIHYDAEKETLWGVTFPAPRR